MILANTKAKIKKCILTSCREFSTNSRHRKVLGDRNALEVMTGRNPASTVNLALWADVKIKDSLKIKTTTELVERHCVGLEKSLGRLHEAVLNTQEARQRRKAIKEAGGRPGMNFRVGDYVMVTASKNQAYPVCHKQTEPGMVLLICRYN